MKKTIGIILRESYKNDDIPLYAFRRDLLPFLRKYDVNVISIPVMFENPEEFSKIKEIVDFCDGIIFPRWSSNDKLRLSINGVFI